MKCELSIVCHIFACIRKFPASQLFNCAMFKLKRKPIKIFASFLFITGLLTSTISFSQDGHAIFQANCATCHKVNDKLVGPALAGVESRWPSRDKIYSWVHNSTAVIKSGDPYAVSLYNEFNKTQMTAFPQLTTKDIDAVLDYIKATPAVTAASSATSTSAASETDNGDRSLIFGILTIILAIVAFTLLQINANLKKMADDKEGIPAHEPIPFWRNKTYIIFATLIIFLVGGYYITQGAIGLGRQQKYQPRQPIFFSHKVHPGNKSN